MRLPNTTVFYDCNAGAPQSLWYTLDAGDKVTLMKGQKQEHYLKPGIHTISIKNPFMKKEYTFRAEGTNCINIYGKSFSMDIFEK